MQATIKHTAPFHGLRHQLSNALAATGRFIVAISENQSRARRVEALSKKSDAELARMGLKREDIVRHVFRDVMYI